MFDSFMTTWQDPYARHATFVHIPIAMGLFGIFPVAYLAWKRFDHRTARRVAVAWFAAASAGAGLAAGAGEGRTR